MPSLNLAADKLPVTLESARRDGRYAARRTLWDESVLRRVRCCGRAHAAGVSEVGVRVTESDNGSRNAGYAGLQSCGSTWACPVCSVKIAAERAKDITAGVDAWNQTGGRVALVTLTMRHRRGQWLSELWDSLSYAWNKTTSTRGWLRDQEAYGVEVERRVKSGHRAGQMVTESRIGYCRVVEVTHGSNGWHVHIHALLFLRAGVTIEDLDNLSASMFGRWVPALERQGLTAPSQKHGIDIRMVTAGDASKLGDYFQKAIYAGAIDQDRTGWEIAGATFKTGRKENRTPFQILEDVVINGDEADLALWHEWERASKGRRQLTWSTGLRDRLGLNEELTDEEIAEQELDGETVLTVTASEWEWVKYRAETLLHLVEQDSTLQLARAWLRRPPE